MAYRLSICIPTYNREALLRPLLDQLCSMVQQGGYGEIIEICISDNGSDDGTWPMLKELAERVPFLSICRNEENQGFGRNFWKVAAMAQGEYIYFSGDDDLFRDDALKILLSNTQKNADLVLVNSHPTAHIRRDSFAPEEYVSLDSLECYLEKVGLFHGSFIGNLMFKREVFERHCKIGDAVFLSAYPHLFPVFRALREGNAIFANQSITHPDDSSRGWRRMQPIYTSVDLARIAKEEIVPFVQKKTVVYLRSRLIKSLPRAVWYRLKRYVSLDVKNPYQSLLVRNLADIYL